MDNLVQFEEDFNSRTKKLRGGVRWGLDRLCQTSPIPRSPDGDKNHALHTGSIEMLDLVSCINPIIYGVYYFSERNFRPRRTSTMR